MVGVNKCYEENSSRKGNSKCWMEDWSAILNTIARKILTDQEHLGKDMLRGWISVEYQVMIIIALYVLTICVILSAFSAYCILDIVLSTLHSLCHL